MPDSLDQLQQQIEQWEARSRRRTALLILIPLFVAVGLAWYGYRLFAQTEEALRGLAAAIGAPQPESLEPAALIDQARALAEAARRLPELEQALVAERAARAEEVSRFVAEREVLAREREVLAQRLRELEGVRDAAIARVAELERQLADLVREAERVGVEREGLLRELAQLRQQLAGWEAERSALVGQVAELRAERERLGAVWRAREEEFAGRVRELEAALAAAREELAWREGELARRLEELEGERLRLEGALAAGERQLEAARAEAERLQQELAATTAELAPLRDQLAERERALAEMMAQLEGLQRQATALAVQREVLVRRLQEAGLPLPDEEVRAQIRASVRPLAPALEAAARAATERAVRGRAVILAYLPGAADIPYVVDGRIVLETGLLFESGRAELTDAGRIQLAAVAQRLREAVAALPRNLPWVLRIDGHTDDLPVVRGRFRNNWELSAARAAAVAEYLVDLGLPRERLMVAGFAEIRPVVANRDEAARARNRRIELSLTVD